LVDSNPTAYKLLIIKTSLKMELIKKMEYRVKKLFSATLFTIFLIFVSSYSLCAEDVFKIATTVIPPYTMQEDGKIGGLATELVENVLQEMNVKYSIGIYPFKRALIMLKQGKLHGLYIAGKFRERAEIYHYAKEPLVTTNWVWFIRKENKGKMNAYSFDDLKGKRIGKIIGYKIPKDLQEYLAENSEVEEVPREELNFMKLARNRVDLIMSEHHTGKYYARKLGIEDKIMPLLEPHKNIHGYIETHHLLFSKKAVTREFVDTYTNALIKFKSTKTYENICSKYQYEGDDKDAILRDMKY